MSTGFKLPVEIPGAPERVTFTKLMNEGMALMRPGLDILQRKPGVYEAEVNQATWWRFWLIVGTGSVIIALASALSSLLFLTRFGFRLNIIGLIISIIVGIVFAAIALYAAAYVSYQYSSKQSSEPVSLVQHAYAVAIVLTPANILGSVIVLIVGLIFASLGWLISLVIAIYALIITVDGFQVLYKFDRNKAWITAAIMIVTNIIATYILGAIVGSLSR
jgi:hypothetical protein